MLQNAANELEKAEIFFTLWTLKESFLKAIGKGLTKSLNSFTIIQSGHQQFRLENDPETEGYYLKTFTLEEGYKLAACAAAAQFCDKITVMKASGLADF
jgi:4'-phosphopantetheinyl transferase